MAADESFSVSVNINPAKSVTAGNELIRIKLADPEKVNYSAAWGDGTF
jgi:hypothetical protein